MLPGTHVTLASMLKHTRGVFDVILFADQVSDADKVLLQQTVERNSIKVNFEIRDYSPKAPKAANSLHGNTTTYGRLYLSELLPECDFVLYLDCDLVINYDVEAIFNIKTDKLLIADGVGVRKYTLDVPLFKAANVDLDGQYFNAGVLGINLKRWRELNALQLCFNAMEQFPNMFVAADQSVLNCTFHNDFYCAGDDINYPVYPITPYYAVPPKKIVHFVGSPKPWDFGGSLHPNHHLWQSWKSATTLPKYLFRYYSLRRIYSTMSSLYKCWKNRR